MTNLDIRIRENFDRQAMMQTLGAKLTRVAPGEIEISAPILPLATQQQGFGHAGLTFSIGDSAAGYAALTLLPEDSDVVTSEIKINLLAPAVGDRLIARGRVVRPGKRLIVVLSEVFAVTDGREKQIALMTGTMVPIPKTRG
ncbi:PaaI family thioesterase [Mesobacterium sp. TK19101]|uniref:Medium/long-chain acyl-CoA thioesterase YigI n=1 Tax=Mesobacterium hydrothermale TaxID=3111907 RepID=A0ABU6HC52_9RHOB|nr:PaaI family thioesterase [Mesobacterium sp. TK19101]MEC3859707.1 PaaI family thioesterase [Mesobacterium sp. TK19101]